MLNKKFFMVAVLCFTAVTILASSAIAGDYRDYDEDVVRAYKKAKIKEFSTKVPVTGESLEEVAVAAIEDYFKSSVKKKPEIILYDYEPFEKKSKNPDGTYLTENFIEVKIYNLKNPEKFIFSLDKETSRKNLTDRQYIKQLLNEDLLVYSILSEKIERKNASFLRKAASFSYNGFLGTMILVPKLGFGYLFNPPLYWMKTNSPKDIYNNVSSELEELSIGEKEFKQVILVQ